MALMNRIATLGGGPHQLALPLHGDAPFDLAWVDEQDFDSFPELEDVEDELDDFLLLAAAQRGETLVPVLVAKTAPHAVSIFYDGFHEVAKSFDAFVEALAAFGQPTEGDRLRSAIAEGSRLIDARHFSNAVEVLERALQAHHTALAEGHRHPLGSQLGQAFTDLGFALNELGDAAKSASAYALGFAHGSTPAGLNLLRLHRDAGDWPAARARAETLLNKGKLPDDLAVVRSIYAIALASLGDAPALEKLTAQHLDWLKWFAADEAEKASSLRSDFVAKLKEAKVDDAARARLDAMATALGQPQLVGKSKAPNERDISSALELIAKNAASRFGNAVKFKPLIAKDPRVLEAVSKLSEPHAAAFREIIESV